MFQIRSNRNRVSPMAGIVGAIIRTPLFPGNPTIYKPYHNLHFHPFQSLIFNSSSKSLSISTMANNINSSPEIKEPSPKIQKLDQTPLFKVKKLSENAVLPSRGSSSAAGYDLARYFIFTIYSIHF